MKNYAGLRLCKQNIRIAITYPLVIYQWHYQCSPYHPLPLSHEKIETMLTVPPSSFKSPSVHWKEFCEGWNWNTFYSGYLFICDSDSCNQVLQLFPGSIWCSIAVLEGQKTKRTVLFLISHTSLLNSSNEGSVRTWWNKKFRPPMFNPEDLYFVPSLRGF